MMSALYLRGLKQGDMQMTSSGLITAGLFFFLSQVRYNLCCNENIVGWYLEKSSVKSNLADVFYSRFADANMYKHPCLLPS